MSESPKATKPDWLDIGLLEKALQSFKKDSTIKVATFTTNNSFSEHFGSVMVQCRVEFSSEKFPDPRLNDISVVIKAKPAKDKSETTGLEAVPLFETVPLFDTEIKMYKEVLPAIQQLFGRSEMKANFIPELVYAADEPFEIIILKDLSPEGFSPLRNPTDNLDDFRMIIEKLAQFHAATFYLAETNELDLSGFTNSIFRDENFVNGLFRDTLKALKEVMESWDGYQQYIPKIDNLIKNASEIGLRNFTPRKPGEGFNVLNHGDFHARNLLVTKNESQRINSLYFVDFQCCVYCNPAMDLSNVFGLLNIDEKGDRPTEELIMFYHHEFVEALKAFGYMKSPPTLLDLNVELLKCGTSDVLVQCCFTPYTFVDISKMKLDEFMGSGNGANIKKDMLEHPIVKQMIQRLLPLWVQKGWL